MAEEPLGGLTTEDLIDNWYSMRDVDDILADPSLQFDFTLGDMTRDAEELSTDAFYQKYRHSRDPKEGGTTEEKVRQMADFQHDLAGRTPTEVMDKAFMEQMEWAAGIRPKKRKHWAAMSPIMLQSMAIHGKRNELIMMQGFEWLKMKDTQDFQKEMALITFGFDVDLTTMAQDHEKFLATLDRSTKIDLQNLVNTGLVDIATLKEAGMTGRLVESLASNERVSRSEQDTSRLLGLMDLAGKFGQFKMAVELAREGRATPEQMRAAIEQLSKRAANPIVSEQEMGEVRARMTDTARSFSEQQQNALSARFARQGVGGADPGLARLQQRAMFQTGAQTAAALQGQELAIRQAEAQRQDRIASEIAGIRQIPVRETTPLFSGEIGTVLGEIGQFREAPTVGAPGSTLSQPSQPVLHTTPGMQPEPTTTALDKPPSANGALKNGGGKDTQGKKDKEAYK